METTGTTYSILPTKKDIIQRLFEEKKITFDEMWILLQENEGTKFIPLPYQVPSPTIIPWKP